MLWIRVVYCMDRNVQHNKIWKSCDWKHFSFLLGDFILCCYGWLLITYSLIVNNFKNIYLISSFFFFVLLRSLMFGDHWRRANTILRNRKRSPFFCSNYLFRHQDFRPRLLNYRKIIFQQKGTTNDRPSERRRHNNDVTTLRHLFGACRAGWWLGQRKRSFHT